MLGMAFQPGGAREHLVGSGAIAVDGDNARLTRGERAGLVEGDQPHARERLERGGVAHQAAVPGQPSDAERGGHRCRQPHRARTGHHQHREADQQRAVERQVLRPVHRRSDAEHENDRHEDADNGVGKALARAAADQRVAHRATDLRPAGRVCHAAASDQERAVKIDAAGDHMRADALGDLPAFAGDHGLVGVRFALDDHAVDGNALSRPNPHQHAGANLAHRPAVLSVAVDDGGPLAFRRQQRLQVARRPCTPGGIEIIAHGEQHQHHGGGVEIDLRAALDRREGRIEIGGADAEHDQRRGGQASLHGVEPCLAHKRSAENDHRGRGEEPEQEMNPRKHLGIGAGEGVGIQQQAEQHDVHGEKAADTEPDQQPRGFRIPRVLPLLT